ncbi:helix-turn-helix domain-containing protein [Peribacillus sp. FSL M8-0224]|uniref:helix-turn-helix domain-containing protein n=1 Tax=Peribacillus sp. FSL M8-0224 TaxID=2921568 RepID=UPI004046CF7A
MQLSNELLKLFRNILGVTIRDVSEKTGYSEGAISRYETGDRKIPEEFAKRFYDNFSIEPSLKTDVILLNAAVRNIKETNAIKKRRQNKHGHSRQLSRVSN